MATNSPWRTWRLTPAEHLHGHGAQVVHPPQVADVDEHVPEGRRWANGS